MYGVVCALCAVKFEEFASRINERGRCVFPVETEMMKLPVVIAIDDKSRICSPCLRKLTKEKPLEENLAAATKELVLKSSFADAHRGEGRESV